MKHSYVLILATGNLCKNEIAAIVKFGHVAIHIWNYDFHLHYAKYFINMEDGKYSIVVETMTMSISQTNMGLEFDSLT